MVRQTCLDGDMPALIEKVPGFKKHIRMFIVHTLATTFQAVKRQNMEQCLDLVSLWSVGEACSRWLTGAGCGCHGAAAGYNAMQLSERWLSCTACFFL